VEAGNGRVHGVLGRAAARVGVAAPE
jgi:hypothetical protein